MTTFPALIPSSRTFTPGEYPATAFSGFSGAQNRVRHSNVFLSAQLRLTFLGLTQAQMLDIWNHYNGRRGEFRSFALPTEVVSYGSITDYVPGNYIWRYAGPGSVEDLPCGGHNVSLTLETVPPVAASVVGADLFLRLRLSAGVAAGGEYAPGISEAITLSVAEGAAFVALNGINKTIALSLEPGEVFGDVEIDGISRALYLGFAIGGSANTGALGINETISLSLVAGAADGGTSSTDPNFANVSLLLHMDGSNGSTTFTDSSSNAFSMSIESGTVTVSTAQSKFGGSSGNFVSGGAIITPSNSAFTFDGDFTIEFWVFRTGMGGTQLDTVLSANNESNLLIRASSFAPGVQLNGGALFATGLSFDLNEWNHIALVRSSGVSTLYKNGVGLGTKTDSSTLTLSKIRLGDSSVSPRYFVGYIDEVRITQGIARWNANFTPPTAPFPDS
jgi:hypothetical protein